MNVEPHGRATLEDTILIDDSTLEIFHHVEASRGKCKINRTRTILRGKALKGDSRYQQDKKRKQCGRSTANELVSVI